MYARVNARRQTVPLATVMLFLTGLVSAQEPSTSDAAPPEVETPWPYELKDGTTVITVYQPQLDSWDGVKLRAGEPARAARFDQGKPRPQSGAVLARPRRAALQYESASDGSMHRSFGGGRRR